MESAGTVLSTNWKDVGKRKVEASPPDDVEHKKNWARAAPSALLLLLKVIKSVRLSSGGNPDALRWAWQPTSPPHVSAFLSFFTKCREPVFPLSLSQTTDGLFSEKADHQPGSIDLNEGRRTRREAGETDRPETSLLESLCFSVFLQKAFLFGSLSSPYISACVQM